MSTDVDHQDIDSICSFKSKKYNKPSEKNKHGQRICFLLKSAEFFSKTNPSLSRSYIKELVEICEKHLIRLKPNVKRKFCKGCNTYLIEGFNSISRNPVDSSDNLVKSSGTGRQSTKDQFISVTCLICTRTRKHKHTD